ncbi:MAG: hypothetical protein M5U26_20315 [Planctomycetota bacterium]|nr:hypothetical protein [Planctomycetota bacterium]
MRFLLHTATTPVEDLALEEAIQLGMEEGISPPTWRVWQAREPALVLGTGQEHAKELHLGAVRDEGIPVLRRHSGGGAVLIGPGVLNYSAFHFIDRLPGAQTIGGAMEAALKPVLEALAVLAPFNSRFAIRNPRFQLAGLSDIAVSAPASELGTRDSELLKKLAGNSQARKRRSVLVHGTLLADPDWAALERYLRFPSRAPDYRSGRAHRAFLTSLKELDAPEELGAFAQALRLALGHSDPIETTPLDKETQTAALLVAEKYARPTWNLRR